jgi:hypothetical protein
MADEPVPDNTPDEVKAQVAKGPREPAADPTLGVNVTPAGGDEPRHRLVTIGDSLTHGFQSGAVFNTDISWPAIVARELGWADYRYPRYGGPGGIPLNIEYILRDLEQRYGSKVSAWELPGALFRARALMDEIEDYWERGPGATVPVVTGINHDLAVYGWDLRDVLSRTYATCEKSLGTPKDDLLSQIVQNNSERAALRVYPRVNAAAKKMTLVDAAAALGADGGIETLVMFIGANNALGTVTGPRVTWSDVGYDDLSKKGRYTIWQPAHFISELKLLEAQVKKVTARHVIWCTVPHVTIAPVTRGVGRKVNPGSRYFPYYTRPWISDSEFDPQRDPKITEQEARAIDYAIDMYNEAIEKMVKAARNAKLDWYLLDMAGLLDRLASRRYIDDPNARPAWWTPYPLPAALKALTPAIDSRFLTSDGNGGRATGGLFSLDGVHPTTIGYGLIAQEVMNIMRRAGVRFKFPSGAERPDPVGVDFDRLILRDTLVRTPPQNLRSTLDMLGWADEVLDWAKRALPQS